MEQRPLRLGDIVDDYCPRERRITNHAIVVLTGPTIELTRCTACESEHPYKHAKLPIKKVKDTDREVRGVLRVRPSESAEALAGEPAASAEPSAEGYAPSSEASEPSSPAPESFHRPLIRAALPKGIVPPAPRPLPDFTMRSIRHRDGRDGRSNGRRFSR